MERYKFIKDVGDGTFGNVCQAINKETGEIVAIKKMKQKYYTWEECMNLREVKSLRRMNHPSIVKLMEVIRENDILYFVFEYMECNLFQLMSGRQKRFEEVDIKNWCFQVFHGLAYMHHREYFHRDLKPENLLVSGDVIKIADLGLARETNSTPPFTEYVSTRWYRAPEVLLKAYVYTSKVDMWAMGAIMAELFSLRPLFPGANEADEIYKICSVLGSPSEKSWNEGLFLAKAINFQFPQLPGVSLPTLIPSASRDAINLISSLCSWDPSKRPTAAEALRHPFFQRSSHVPPSLRFETANARTSPPVGTMGWFEHPSARRYPGAFPNAHTINNSNSTRRFDAPFATGVQRRLDLVNQDPMNDNNKPLNGAANEAKYIPPGRKNPNPVNRKGNNNMGGTWANMAAVVAARPPPPPMKSGWVGKSLDKTTNGKQRTEFRHPHHQDESSYGSAYFVGL